nr:hypothetical protein GCM10020092_077390 [Actinoplanes digitatis]
MAAASQTRGVRRARSSPAGEPPGVAATSGTRIRTAARVIRKTAAMTRYATRHPAVCPSRVIRGTPTMFAAVSPLSTTAYPRACLPGPINVAASSPAAPK